MHTILVAGESHNITGEYSERDYMSEQKTVTGYQTLDGEFCEVNGEFSNLWCLIKTLRPLRKIP